MEGELVGEQAELRFARGKEIAARADGVQESGEHTYSVASQYGSKRHKVELDDGFRRCSCKDFAKNRGQPCKHIWAAWIAIFHPDQASTEKKPRKQYPQNTRAYDLGQTNELRLFPVLLKGLVEGVPEAERLPGAPGRPSTPLREEIICTVLKVYSGFSSRRAHGFHDLAATRGDISRSPSFMVSSRFLNREEVTPILYDLVRESAWPVFPIEQGEAIAPDSTGVQTTSFGAWRTYKHGEKRQHHWLKLHLIAGLKTHVILNAIVDGVHSGDSPQFERLLRGALESGVKPGFLVGDAGYLSERNYDLAAELGLDAIIKFRSNSKNRTSSSGHSKAWKKAYYLFAAHPEEFARRYHKRSNVESVMAAIKAKLGENVRSKNSVAQVNEVLCKAIAYNLTVVIHEMFEHGIAGQFRRQSGSEREPG